MTDTPSQQDVQNALETIKLSDGESLAKSGRVSDVFIADDKVFFSISCDAAEVDQFESVRLAAEKAVKAIPAAKGAMVALTAEKKAGTPNPAPQPAHAPRPAPQNQAGKAGVNGVKNIIAVASGKGGVGKSTTAINIALGLQSLGLKVGVLDADIYGPSMPRLLGITQKPETVEGGKILKPIEKFGLQVMSIGFLVEEDTPMIWRGPMVMSALTQMLREVAWEALDILVVDMPPGTGDAQLTMAQQVPLAGAVIVSTPQDLSLIDARKGLNMFKKVDVPVLGIVENMSYFIAPDTGARYDIFGHGGAKAEAAKLSLPFLGEVPLVMEIRELSDAGTPITIHEPDGPHAAVYKQISANVNTQMEAATGGRAAPKIVFE